MDEAKWHRRQNVLDEIGGALRHASPEARRAKAAAFARERDESLLVALLTLKPGKPSESNAIQVQLELVAHERG